MKAFTLICVLATALKGIFALNIVNSTSLDSERRSADTCADPNLAVKFRQWYSISQRAHVLDLTIAIVNANTETGADWTWQADSFLAWGSPQEFVFPFYVFVSTTTGDNIYLLSSDGTVPTVAGAISGGIVGFAYSTQICGSVPLFSLANAAAGDHWYTTSTAERDALISVGWADEGVMAFVLPVPSWCVLP
ncbi:hypothetical protein CVT26_003409 [Gymnopilus dilepis]|uniref:DUF5648 domain-containing protein n=1 Tax=Gymnopilus dilepis TaxID=231916 RepID=A0A409Y5K1_9AGAR|nr:hypothetical protein CVT26_003409 [Gymnopilus dilepis]